MSRMCAYCGVGEASMALPCVSTAGHWFSNIPNVSVVTQCQLCQRGEPCGENLKLTLEAENALLKKKLEMALQGIEHYGDESFWDDPHEDSGYERATLYNFEDEFDGPLSGYELARSIKAEIEEVK